MNCIRTVGITALALILFTASPGQAATEPAKGSSVAHSGGPSSGRDFGLGLMVGEPTGVSAKYWLSQESALDFGLTWSWKSWLGLHADYLWHFPRAFGSGVGSQFVPFIGLGAIVGFGDFGPDGRWVRDGNRLYWTDNDAGIGLGARIPLGIEFLPRSIPLGVFVEVVPGVGLSPGVYAFLQGAIGARFYF